MDSNKWNQNLSTADFELLDSLGIVFEDKANLNYYHNTKTFDIDQIRNISIIKKRNYKYNLIAIVSFFILIYSLLNNSYRLENIILLVLLIAILLLFSYRFKEYDCKLVIFFKGNFCEIKIKNKDKDAFETILKKLRGLGVF